jgi:hypothetical protein
MTETDHLEISNALPKNHVMKGMIILFILESKWAGAVANNKTGTEIAQKIGRKNRLPINQRIKYGRCLVQVFNASGKPIFKSKFMKDLPL